MNGRAPRKGRLRSLLWILHILLFLVGLFKILM